ncbi:MAG: methyltransferase domain-containing protein [Pseudorhodoplanes sp.]|nr:methyltransferase domain-containing protein [Pseudorhodoplanes sp.]
MAAVSTTLSPEDAERFRSYERQRHDNLATTYHDFFTPITALAIKSLLDAVRLQTGVDLLDVATGPGSLAAEANRLGARTVGVDLSPGMIELAEKSYPGIDFRVAEVERLPFADRSFDAVVCNFALGHFPYPEASVAECVRTLRRGGRIALSWWDVPSKQRIQGLFREAITEIGVASPPDVPTGYSILRFADTNEFRRLLEDAGLTDVMVEDHQTTYLIPDVDTLWRGGLGSFAVTASAIAHQDAATQAAIRGALERRATAYKTPAGLKLPVAFKIGAGRKAD